MILEEDLRWAISVIGQCLSDLDQVSGTTWNQFWDSIMILIGLQLDEIPGEVESEKGFKDTVSN